MHKILKGLFILLVLQLLIGCNSEGAFSEFTVKLERIDIIPSKITTQGVSELRLAVGNKLFFEAIGHYSDGSSRLLSDLSVNDWHTSERDVGYFYTSGVLIGDNPGTTTVTATKDGITSNAVNVSVTAAVITNITVTPAVVNVVKGQTQQLTATAMYSDSTSSDITNSVTWESVDTATTTVTPEGLLSGVEVGTTTVTATKDGITSNAVNVRVCISLANKCIDIFDIGNGKLFTNSPSVAYLDSIGGSATDSINIENGSFGPAGTFYLFNWANANALCATYSAKSIGGRTNWRLATRDELKSELFDRFGSMFIMRGWPTFNYYWSLTPGGSGHYIVLLNLGYISSSDSSYMSYVSCVSNP